MIIMKFGGTSVGSIDAIERVRTIVQERKREQPVVVVSAVSGVTNLLQAYSTASLEERKKIVSVLQETHHDIIVGLGLGDDGIVREHLATVLAELSALPELLTLESRDVVLSVGERLSSVIVSRYFSQELASEAVDARELFVTDSHHGAAEIIDSLSRQHIEDRLLVMVQDNVVPVVTGFIGSDEHGKTTTLGRGGSDYSAALLGYYLHAEEIQIWTDVDGVYSTDPRDVANARLLTEITYQEVGELAAFGAKVLHPKTMRPAVAAQIPIVIANTFHPEGATTRVIHETKGNGLITAVASKKQITMVNIYAVEMLLEKGFLARISHIFANNNISIDLISATETSVSVTLDNQENLESAVDELRAFSRVTVEKEAGLVTLIGQDLPSNPALLSTIFDSLSRSDIATKMISVGAQNVNVSLVVAKNDVLKTIQVTHALCLDQAGGRL